MKKLLAASFIVFLLFSAKAWALSIETDCGSADLIRRQLAEKFNEVLVNRGLVNSYMVELWASSEGTFTVLLIVTADVACILTGGTAWHQVGGIAL